MNYLPERGQFRNRDRIKRFANIRRQAASTNVTVLFIDVQQRLRTSEPHLLTSNSVYERYSLIYWRPAASPNVTALFIDVQQRLRTLQPYLLTSKSVTETSYTDLYERHSRIWINPEMSTNVTYLYNDLHYRLTTL